MESGEKKRAVKCSVGRVCSFVEVTETMRIFDLLSFLSRTCCI